MPTGRGIRARLTQSTYRQACAETVRSLQNGGSDQDMADAWGVSAATVGNVRNQRNDLSGVPLLKLGEAFGPEGLNTMLALVGLRVEPIESVTLDIASIPCNVAGCLPTLIRLLADGDCSEADIRQLDKEGIIDCFARLADMLTQRRDDQRLRAVA